MFYTYNQNNSGGHFAYDEKDGISHYVIIEATDPDHANARARKIGLYFGGDGDCSCCGDRWNEASSYDGHETPQIYTGVDALTYTGQDIPGNGGASWGLPKWMKGYEGFIHYLGFEPDGPGPVVPFWPGDPR